MSKADIELDRVTSFLMGGEVLQQLDDGSEAVVDINGWVIKGAIIVDAEDASQDILMTGVVTDAVNGLYEITVTDIDKDALFAAHLNKQGICYELIATFPDNTGAELASGTVVLKHSRDLSKK